MNGLIAAAGLLCAALQTGRIDALLRDRLGGIPEGGFVLGVVEDGQSEVITRGRSAEGPLTADTEFDAGGLADVFLGVLLAEMAAAGEVALQDPVAKHLPGVAVPTRNGRSITLEDLALHRSGLPRLLPGTSRAEAARLSTYTGERLSPFLAAYELTRDIGSEYQRSLLGTGLLAAAVSARTGVPIEQLLESRVFRPLGLASTRFDHGSLRSTGRDLTLFASRNLAADGPLADRLDDARSSRGNVGRTGEGLGLGWRIRRLVSREIAWGSGAAGGNQAFVGVEVSAGRAVVVLHTHPLSVDEVGFSVLEELHEVRTAPDPSLLESFAGEYEVKRGLTVVVRVHERKLAIAIGNEPESTLSHEEDVRFTFDDSDARVTFVRDAAGATIGLIVHRGSQYISARKVR